MSILELSKGPNRRLYSPEEHCYITIKDVRRYLEEGRTVRVTDRATRQDVTIDTFLRIISVQQQSERRLSADALAEVIRKGPLAILDPRLATEMRNRKVTHRELLDMVCQRPVAA